MQTFTVVYRTGNFRNPVWKSTFPYDVEQDAERTKRQMEMTGTKALIYPTDELARVGMPKGWEPQQEFFTEEIRLMEDPKKGELL